LRSEITTRMMPITVRHTPTIAAEAVKMCTQMLSSSGLRSGSGRFMGGRHDGGHRRV
jgi:hypothetical protein